MGAWTAITPEEERQIIKMYQQGLKDADIAAALGRTKQTVQKHRTMMLKYMAKHGNPVEPPKLEKVCPSCGKTFSCSPTYHHAKYCSKQCKQYAGHLRNGGKMTFEEWMNRQPRTNVGANTPKVKYYNPPEVVGGYSERRIIHTTKRNAKKWGSVADAMQTEGLSYAELQKRGYFNRTKTD